MPVTAKPFRRTCRQFIDGKYAEGGRARYILHPKYAGDPQRYVRAFLLLQRDFQDLFEHVEPSDQNGNTYSFRIHGLLMRVCIELEANFKAILLENGYKKSTNLTMRHDYVRVQRSHLLSRYRILIPYWDGSGEIRTPFAAWASQDPLPWYQAYNAAKHDRHREFKSATFDHLADAMCGLAALISAQFYSFDFGPGPGFLMLNGCLRDNFNHCVGSFFGVDFPEFPDDERYSFNSISWEALRSAESDPFLNFDYGQPADNQK